MAVLKKLSFCLPEGPTDHPADTAFLLVAIQEGLAFRWAFIGETGFTDVRAYKFYGRRQEHSWIGEALHQMSSPAMEGCDVPNG